MSTLGRSDVVIFGASGHTGRRVVGELTRIGEKHPDITWAVAGRNKNKLEKILQNVSNKSGVDLSKVKIITADVEDETSLRDMCRRAKVLVNCCGPFLEYGEAVVAAAIESKTHYIDVSGELQFIEILIEKYDQPARDAGVYVISACGVISLPADVGVQFMEDHFDGVLNSVESYLITRFPPNMFKDKGDAGVVLYSSWNSLINSMSQVSLNKMKQRQSCKLAPGLKSRLPLHKYSNRWCLPFPGTDLLIVNRTQHHLSTLDEKRPVQYKSYVTFPSIFIAIGAVIGCLFLFILSKINCTKRLLLKYPKFFSFGLVTHDDPKEGIMDNSCFQYDLLGKGWDKNTDLSKTPDKSIVARISISGEEPAYVGSAVVVVLAAIAVLKEGNKLPIRRGYLTPGVAFRKTNIVKNLQENYFNFEIVKISK